MFKKKNKPKVEEVVEVQLEQETEVEEVVEVEVKKPAPKKVSIEDMTKEQLASYAADKGYSMPKGLSRGEMINRITRLGG